MIDDRKTALERNDATWLQKKWRALDNNYIKKLFGGDLTKASKVQSLAQLSKEQPKTKPKKKSVRESLFQEFEK